MEPILLFKVKLGNIIRGVYYNPQYGVVMDGVRTNGSVRAAAKHIANTEYSSYEAAKVNPGTLKDEDAIIQTISEWINK